MTYRIDVSPYDPKSKIPNPKSVPTGSRMAVVLLSWDWGLDLQGLLADDLVSVHSLFPVNQTNILFFDRITGFLGFQMSDFSYQ